MLNESGAFVLTKFIKFRFEPATPQTLCMSSLLGVKEQLNMDDEETREQ